LPIISFQVWNCTFISFRIFFPSSGLLHGVRWFQTDVSGLPIGSSS
jgi:hypothetical protein